jgi:membrane protease YdiL (CAAX protease family)
MPPTATRPARWHLVPLLYLGSMGVLLYGCATSPFDYTDPRFVVSFFPTQVAVLLLLLATFALVPGASIGLRRPALVSVRQVVPLGLVVGTAFFGWLAARLTLPPGAPVDNGLSLGILRTTLLVGVTEEWVYRGLALAFLWRLLGARHGAYLALLLFGLLHLLNMAAGVPPPLAATQVLITMTIGASLLLAAVGTRSIWVVALLHGLYDFLVIDANSLRAAGAAAWTGYVGMPVTCLVGIYAFTRVWSLQGAEPYPDAGSPPPRST